MLCKSKFAKKSIFFAAPGQENLQKNFIEIILKRGAGIKILLKKEFV